MKKHYLVVRNGLPELKASERPYNSVSLGALSEPLLGTTIGLRRPQ